MQQHLELEEIFIQLDNLIHADKLSADEKSTIEAAVKKLKANKTTENIMTLIQIVVNLLGVFAKYFT